MKSLIPVEVIDKRIYYIRNHKIMLDSDLAKIYGIPTHRLNETVKRNRDRFPEDFMFQITKDEQQALISQNAISKKQGRGGHRKKP